MENFILWSGWICTLISAVIAVIQFFEKEKYKKEIAALNLKIRSENYTANEKGVAIRENRGDITIN